MHTRILEAALLRITPYPQISKDRSLVPGLSLDHVELCFKCPDRRCAEYHNVDVREPVLHTLCYRGMGVAVAMFDNKRVVLNGLVTPTVSRGLSRRDKKSLANSRVEPEDIDAWYEDAREAIAVGARAVQERIDDTLGMLHDVQTSVSSLLRSAESFVQEQPGGSMEEKLDNLSPSAMSVFKAVQLLQSRLALMPLLTNPDAARYGQKRPTPVYRVIDKIVRTMRPMAERSRINLQLRGTSFKTPRAYDSFETIPLVLIDNAIKYSLKNQDVTIEVEDQQRGVRVAVLSFSPSIPSQERPHLFERGFRGKGADKVASRGSGLGLYMAALVAEVHGFDISQFGDGRSIPVDGVEYCTNTFAFIIPD